MARHNYCPLGQQDFNNNGPHYERTKQLRSVATPQAAESKINDNEKGVKVNLKVLKEKGIKEREGE